MQLTEKITNIANKIRSYTKKTEKMKLEEMPTEIEAVYNKGVEDNNLAFWNNYAGKLATDVRYMFAGNQWTDTVFQTIPFAIKPRQTRYMFNMSDITKVSKEQVDFSEATILRETFLSSSIKECEMSAIKCSNLRETFEGCSSLETLWLEVAEITTYTRPFGGCTGLKNLTIIGTIGGAGFDLSDCTLLDLGSITSVLLACNKKNAGITITLPSYCIDGETDILEAIINGGAEIQNAYAAAIANGYTISFN